jgi:hypothetical protein
MKKQSLLSSFLKLKNFSCLLILFISFLGHSQGKQIFENPQLKTIISLHKVVAIMPYRTSITYKRQPKNFSAEANRDQEKSMSMSIQSSMYTFLLRKSKNYNVSFQDVGKTNILLKKAGMLDKLGEFTNDEIAKVLGVDAIIGGVFETEQTKSEAGAIASAILFGGLGGKTGTGSLTMTLNNGSDGELLWRFFKTMDQGIMASTDDIVESMMRKVARNFPYAI